MPKMKTHHWAEVTLSLKNCFGCLPGRVYGWPKNVLHWVGIQNSILEIAAAVRPCYPIVDGIVGMEGDGPIRGAAVDAGMVVFGDDPVATDTVASTLMGFDPERIDYLAEAGRFLGQVDRARIDDTGEPPGRHRPRLRARADLIHRGTIRLSHQHGPTTRPSPRAPRSP